MPICQIQATEGFLKVVTLEGAILNTIHKLIFKVEFGRSFNTYRLYTIYDVPEPNLSTGTLTTSEAVLIRSDKQDSESLTADIFYPSQVEVLIMDKALLKAKVFDKDVDVGVITLNWSRYTPPTFQFEKSLE